MVIKYPFWISPHTTRTPPTLHALPSYYTHSSHTTRTPLTQNILTART